MMLETDKREKGLENIHRFQRMQEQQRKWTKRQRSFDKMATGNVWE